MDDFSSNELANTLEEGFNNFKISDFNFLPMFEFRVTDMWTKGQHDVFPEGQIPEGDHWWDFHGYDINKLKRYIKP